MQDACGPTRQALQGFWQVQIAQHGGDAQRPEVGHFGWTGSQCHHPRSTHQLFGSALPHIAATDDQNPFFSKAGGQSAQRGLV
jgi:hypothetical protein